MNNAHNGYRNTYDWKKADPEGYEKYLGGFEEKMKFKLDEDFAGKIANIEIDPNDEFANAIDRACKGELTPEEMAICEKGPKGITAPPLPPKKWYVKFWEWVKGFFVKQRTMEDFKKQYKPASKTVPVPKRDLCPRVEINENFDFQEWVVERHERIKKAIKEDGKEENTITCPVCYKERIYCVMESGAIRSTCQGCGINMM